MKNKFIKYGNITTIIISLICCFSISSIMFGLTDDQMKALDEKITLMNDSALRSNLIKSLRDFEHHQYWFSHDAPGPNSDWGTKENVEKGQNSVLELAKKIDASPVKQLNFSFQQEIKDINIKDKNAHLELQNLQNLLKRSQSEHGKGKQEEYRKIIEDIMRKNRSE